MGLGNKSNHFSERVVVPSYGLLGLLLVVLMLIVPVTVSAQGTTATGGTVPDSADVVIAPELFDRATTSFNTENYRSAEIDLSLFILLNPTFSPAYYYRARALEGEQEFDRAMQDYDQAVSLSATFADEFVSELLTARGDLLRRNRRFNDAFADYTQAISIDAPVPALFGRGLLYLQQNDLDGARGDFDNAIDQQVDNAVLYLYRGLVISYMDDPEAAAADYLEFLNLIESTSIEDEALTSGITVLIEMDSGVQHRFNFEAVEGQQLIAIAAAESATVDPLMVIVDSDGLPLIASDDTGASKSSLIRAYTIPADDTYTLIVGHSLGGSQGQITVGVELQGGT